MILQKKHPTQSTRGILYVNIQASIDSKFNLKSKIIISPKAQHGIMIGSVFPSCETTNAKDSHAAATFCELSWSPA